MSFLAYIWTAKSIQIADFDFSRITKMYVKQESYALKQLIREARAVAVEQMTPLKRWENDVIAFLFDDNRHQNYDFIYKRLVEFRQRFAAEVRGSGPVAGPEAVYDKVLGFIFEFIEKDKASLLTILEKKLFKYYERSGDAKVRVFIEGIANVLNKEFIAPLRQLCVELRAFIPRAIELDAPLEGAELLEFVRRKAVNTEVEAVFRQHENKFFVHNFKQYALKGGEFFQSLLPITNYEQSIERLKELMNLLFIPHQYLDRCMDFVKKMLSLLPLY